MKNPKIAVIGLGYVGLPLAMEFLLVLLVPKLQLRPLPTNIFLTQINALFEERARQH